MDKFSNVLAEILFSVESINNKLRVATGLEPRDCGFSQMYVPATEESLPLITSLLEDTKSLIDDIFPNKD